MDAAPTCRPMLSLQHSGLEAPSGRLERLSAGDLPPAHPGRTRGAELMIAGSVSFGLMAVALRLATAQVSSSEAAFFRSLFGLLFSLPLLWLRGLALLRTQHFHLYIVRSG